MSEKEHESVTRIEPNSFYQPYLNKGLQRAESFYNRYGNVPYYPGQTYPSFSPESESAFGMVGGLAGSSMLPGQASEELGRTLSGAYLDPTKDPRFRRGLDEIENRIGSRFAASNRLGSGAFYNSLADAESAAAAQLYGEERGRMLGGLALSPSIEAARYAPAGALAGVGAQREARERERIAGEMARYETNVAGGRQRQALGVYQNSVNSSPYANYASTVTPYYTNPVMEGFGYASAGLGLLGQAGLLGMNATGGGGGGGQFLGGGYGGQAPYDPVKAQLIGGSIYGF